MDASLAVMSTTSGSNPNITESPKLTDPFNLTGPWDNVDKRIGTTVSTTLANQTQKSIKELLYNGTGYFIEDEGDSGGLNDVQTLFLACFATLIPLVLSLFTAFGIRILWTKYKRRKENAQYDGILHRDATSDSIARPLHSHLLNDKQCGDTHLAIGTEEVEICEAGNVNSCPYRSNNHCNTNGSIITMTLKNNHLIVETEERNDIEEDSRETTMKYSPGARDGVFVVEVQQGVRRSPSSGPTSCKEQELSNVSDQCALVHNPPDRFSDEDTLEECEDSEYMETASPSMQTPGHPGLQVKTGLAQSNTSLSSNRQSYCYTNQQCYDTGSYGYTTYSGYVNDEPQKRLHDDENKPKIMAAVYKKQLSLVNGDDIGELQTEICAKDVDNLARNAEDVEQSMLGNIKTHIRRGGSPKFEKLQNDISPTTVINKKEADVRSVEYENKGFEINDTTKS